MNRKGPGGSSQGAVKSDCFGLLSVAGARLLAQNLSSALSARRDDEVAIEGHRAVGVLQELGHVARLARENAYAALRRGRLGCRDELEDTKHEGLWWSWYSTYR